MARRDQAASADIVLIAVNWSKLPVAVAGLPAWSGRIVVDANNPIEAPLFKPVDLHGLISSQVVADLVAGARLVKAFNHLRADVLASDPRADGGRRVLFYSGDDSAPKAEEPPFAFDNCYSRRLKRLVFSTVIA